MNTRKYKAAGVLSFALPVAVMIVVFGIKKIYPFGDRSFLSTDLYHQYMPFFCEFMRAVRSGHGLAYTWNVGVGSNFLALYAYYLASPFHWLGLLVPEAHIMEFLTYLVVFKIGLCGLTAFMYLESRGRRLAAREDEPGKHLLLAQFFSLAYALSGFMAAYNWNIMWLDCVILLPVIVWGLERLVREGKPGAYCLALGASILTNFYISIMICFFVVLYFGFLYFTERHPMCEENSAGKRIAWHLRPVGQFALYSLLAGGIAAVLLVPEIYSVLSTDFGDISFPQKIESYFSVLDMLARHCVAVSVEKGLDHWPNIYCGAAVFLCVPLYALNGEIPARRRFGMLFLAGFMLLGFSTNVLNFIWHGLNYPDSLPARQSFIYIFLILSICYDSVCFLDLRCTQQKERILHSYLGAAAALLLAEKFVKHEDFQFGVIWLTLLFVTVYGVAWYLAFTHESRRWRMVLGYLALVVMVLETGINTEVTSVSNVSRSSYLEHQEDYKDLYAWAKGQEDGFFRVEKFERKTKNDGTLAGYPTASVFSSTMNSAVMDLYGRLGMRHSKVYYCYDGATAFTGALLNVKYLFDGSEREEGDFYEFSGSSNGLRLYRAVYTLPLGYVAPEGYDLPEGYENSALRLQNQMAYDLGATGQMFIRCEKSSMGDDVSFTAPEDGEYYGILTSGGTGKVKVIGSFIEQQEYNDLKNGSVLYLGYLEAGRTVYIGTNDESDTTREVAVDVYRMDKKVLGSVIEKLSETSMQEVKLDSTDLTGRVDMEQPGRLILSIPYEKGWRVTLNGERVEPQLFGGTFMAFDLKPGEYDLAMHYVPYGQWQGIFISVVCIAVFVVLNRLERRSGSGGRRNAKKTGDEPQVTVDDGMEGLGIKRNEKPELRDI